MDWSRFKKAQPHYDLFFFKFPAFRHKTPRLSVARDERESIFPEISKISFEINTHWPSTEEWTVEF